VAIAIKRAALGRYEALTERFAEEDRTAMKLTCPEIGCGVSYVVWFGPATDEGAARELIEPYLRRDHPEHRDIYAANEPMPRI
jgi:hypothetical protein